MPVRTRTFIIDIVLILVFAILARLAHGGVSLGAIIDTFWPFAVGGLIGTGIVAARKSDSYTPQSGVIIWVATALAGLGIWAIRHQELPHISFIIVASCMSALLLLSWRFIAAQRIKAV